MAQNYLKAVFWDYPHLCDAESIHKALKQAYQDRDIQTAHWIMARFLERGRVKDTALFFRPKEIEEGLRHVKISKRARKRWERLLEVYGNKG